MRTSKLPRQFPSFVALCSAAAMLMAAAPARGENGPSNLADMTSLLGIWAEISQKSASPQLVMDQEATDASAGKATLQVGGDYEIFALAAKLDGWLRYLFADLALPALQPVKVHVKVSTVAVETKGKKGELKFEGLEQEAFEVIAPWVAAAGGISAVPVQGIDGASVGLLGGGVDDLGDVFDLAKTGKGHVLTILSSGWALDAPLPTSAELEFEDGATLELPALGIQASGSAALVGAGDASDGSVIVTLDGGKELRRVGPCDSRGICARGRCLCVASSFGQSGEVTRRLSVAVYGGVGSALPGKVDVQVVAPADPKSGAQLLKIEGGSVVMASSSTLGTVDSGVSVLFGRPVYGSEGARIRSLRATVKLRGDPTTDVALKAKGKDLLGKAKGLLAKGKLSATWLQGGPRGARLGFAGHRHGATSRVDIQPNGQVQYRPGQGALPLVAVTHDAAGQPRLGLMGPPAPLNYSVRVAASNAKAHDTASYEGQSSGATPLARRGRALEVEIALPAAHFIFPAGFDQQIQAALGVGTGGAAQFTFPAGFDQQILQARIAGADKAVKFIFPIGFDQQVLAAKPVGADSALFALGFQAKGEARIEVLGGILQVVVPGSVLLPNDAPVGSTALQLLDEDFLPRGEAASCTVGVLFDPANPELPEAVDADAAWGLLEPELELLPAIGAASSTVAWEGTPRAAAVWQSALAAADALPVYARRDPVAMLSGLAKSMRSGNFGRWGANNGDGKEPWEWTGSSAILKTQGKGVVKYGQCWVFSGTLTSLARSVGIPTRVMTNLNSAHERGHAIAAGTALPQPGPNACLGTTTDGNGGSKTWNFHVWVESYQRPGQWSDGGSRTLWIAAKGGKPSADWNAYDATPQEQSSEPQGLFGLQVQSGSSWSPASLGITPVDVGYSAQDPKDAFAGQVSAVWSKALAEGYQALLKSCSRTPWSMHCKTTWSKYYCAPLK